MTTCVYNVLVRKRIVYNPQSSIVNPCSVYTFNARSPGNGIPYSVLYRTQYNYKQQGVAGLPRRVLAAPLATHSINGINYQRSQPWSQRTSHNASTGERRQHHHAGLDSYSLVYRSSASGVYRPCSERLASPMTRT